MTALATRTVPAAAAVSGPPVLLVHGFCSRGAVDWPDAEWAGPLSALGRDVVVVDLPGHGDSDAVAAPLPTHVAVGLLADAVRAAGGTVDVVAYSLGARLAWELAGEPEVTVRRLVLGGLSPVEPFGMVDLAAARGALAGGPEPSDPLTGMILSMTRLPGNDPESLLNVVEGFAGEPFDPAARPPRVPALLLGGLDDPMAQGVDALAAALPDARVERVPGDHVGALRSRELRDTVTDFLTREDTP